MECLCASCGWGWGCKQGGSARVVPRTCGKTWIHTPAQAACPTAAPVQHAGCWIAVNVSADLVPVRTMATSAGTFVCDGCMDDRRCSVHIGLLQCIIPHKRTIFNTSTGRDDDRSPFMLFDEAIRDCVSKVCKLSSVLQELLCQNCAEKAHNAPAFPPSCTLYIFDVTHKLVSHTRWLLIEQQRYCMCWLVVSLACSKCLLMNVMMVVITSTTAEETPAVYPTLPAPVAPSIRVLLHPP